MKLRCPECRNLKWYFDSPTMHVNICLEKGKMILRRQLDNRKIPRREELRKKLIEEVSSEMFGWTCGNCGESVWIESNIWIALRDEALKFLKKGEKRGSTNKKP